MAHYIVKDSPVRRIRGYFVKRVKIVLILVLAAVSLGACDYEDTLIWDEVRGDPPGTMNHLLYEATGQNMQAEGHTHPWEEPPPPAKDVWWDLAGCETGYKYNNPNTGNGYYGYFQFDLQTWQSVGGPGYPHYHSYETQKSYAQELQARRGWSPWPYCSEKLGLR